MPPNDPTYEVLLKLLKQSENISEMMSQVLDKQSANTIQQPARPKRKIERYSISISEASLICETSERTFSRRMEGSLELRHLMRLKPAAACRKAVRQWWDVAFGIPGIAVISQTTQAADNKGEDTNVPVQVNPVTTKP